MEPTEDLRVPPMRISASTKINNSYITAEEPWYGSKGFGAKESEIADLEIARYIPNARPLLRVSILTEWEDHVAAWEVDARRGILRTHELFHGLVSGFCNHFQNVLGRVL